MPIHRLVELQRAAMAPQLATAAARRPVRVTPAAAGDPVSPALDATVATVIAPRQADAGALRAVRLDPGVARMRLDRLRPELFDPVKPLGFERKDSPHAISPVAQPSDATLFEDAHSDVRYFLPRYRLRTTAPGRYDVNVVADPQASGLWVVSLGLEAYPAPELGDAARTAQTLPHPLDAALSYRLPGSTIERRLPATELLSDARGPVVIFRLGLAERDELLGAFMAQSAGASLSVMRPYTVAVPLAAPAPTPGPVPGRRPPVAVPVPPGMPRPRFPVADTLPRHSLNLAANRQLMLKRRFEIDPRLVAGTGIAAAPAAAVPQRYRALTQSPAVTMPLWFDSALHAYVYPGGSPSAGSAVASLQMHSVPYSAPGRSARHHSYLQSSSQPTRFYFLPDAFRLARTEHPPFKPALAFVVDQSPSTDPGATQTAVELIADVRPVTDGKRLLAAREALKSKLPTTGVAPGEISLEPLLAPSVLRLGLPRGGRMQTIEVAAQVDLANGFQLNESFALDDFQDVFAALMAPRSAALLQGHVAVSTGLGGGEILVPVELNFRALEGELFQYTETTDSATGTVAVQLINQTGGALHIPALPVWLSRDGAMVPARTEGLDLSQAIELPAEGVLGFQVLPVDPWPDALPTGPLDAVFDTSAITAVPDPEALFAQTFDNSVDQETARAITVMTDAEVLTSAQAPDKAIRFVIIEFRGNKSVRLSDSKLEEAVEVPVPLMDVLLRRDTEGQYEYRQTVVYRSGTQTSSGWRKTDLGLLFVPFEGGD